MLTKEKCHVFMAHVVVSDANDAADTHE